MMSEFVFLFQNVWKQLIYNKFMSLIMLLTMLVGFLFPLMAMNDVNDLLADQRMTYIDASHMAIIDYYMVFKEEADMHAAIESGRERGLIVKAGYCALSRQIIYAGEESYSGSISSVSAGYMDLNVHELLSGEMFSEDDYAGIGERVCMIGHRSNLLRDGIRIGDTIELLGEVFKVKGIIRAPRIYGSILIPYAMTEELLFGSNNQSQYQILTYSEMEPNPKTLSPRLFPGEFMVTAQTGVEQEEIYNQSVYEANRYRILRAMVVIGFAMVNFFILLTGKMIHQRYHMTVRMATGASSSTVRAEVITANLCLMMIAFLIDLFLYHVIASFIDGSNRYLLTVTTIQVFIGGLLIVTISSMISHYISFKGREIALLLKKQG